MSGSKVWSLKCDGCGEVYPDFGESLKETRQKARESGWGSVTYSAKNDFCEDCFPRYEHTLEEQTTCRNCGMTDAIHINRRNHGGFVIDQMKCSGCSTMWYIKEERVKGEQKAGLGLH